MRRKLLILIPLALLVLAAAGLAGTWLWAARALEQGYTAWLEDRRAEGYRFENATGALGGFPLRLTASLDRPAVHAPQGWSWQGPAVHAEADVLAPFTVRVRAPGRHRVSTMRGRELVARAGSADGRVLFRAGGGARSGQITLADVRLEGLPAGPTSADALFLALGPRRAPADAPPELDFVLEADAVALPAGLDTPLERKLTRLAARGTLLGPLPPEPDAARLRAWRAAGGALRLDHVALDWAPLRLQGDGRLTLDRRLRPTGKLQVAVRGLGATLDRLAAAGTIDPDLVSYAKLAISALGQTDRATGETEIDLPIELRDGRFYLGPLPLFRLRPVV